MRYRNEILKFLPLKELEERIKVLKIELNGLFSTEACEFIIAKELGLVPIEKSLEMKEVDSKGMLFERFNKFIEELKENNFLKTLSKTLGVMFAHNYCCHEWHNLPDIHGEDVDFNKFIKEIKIKFYEERMRMNDEWYSELEKPPKLEAIGSYERSKEIYEHMLGHLIEDTPLESANYQYLEDEFEKVRIHGDERDLEILKKVRDIQTSEIAKEEKSQNLISKFF